MFIYNFLMLFGLFIIFLSLISFYDSEKCYQKTENKAMDNVFDEIRKNKPNSIQKLFKIGCNNENKKNLSKFKNFKCYQKISDNSRKINEENLELKEAVVVCLNRYRALYKVPLLTEEARITKAAQIRAQEIAKTRISNKVGNKYGENIWWINKGSKGVPLAETICADCYREGDNYQFRGSHNSSCFTQMVWKSSTQVGVGIAKVKTLWVVVTFFYPSGNIKGGFYSNVMPPVY